MGREKNKGSVGMWGGARDSSLEGGGHKSGALITNATRPLRHAPTALGGSHHHHHRPPPQASASVPQRCETAPWRQSGAHLPRPFRLPQWETRPRRPASTRPSAVVSSAPTGAGGQWPTGTVCQIRCIQKDCNSLVLFGGVHRGCIWGDIVVHVGVWRSAVIEHRSTKIHTNINKDKRKFSSVSNNRVWHNGKRPLFHAVMQRNAKHYDVKCNRSVSNVLSMHRIHCGDFVRVFGRHW